LKVNVPEKGFCKGCGKDILWIKNENRKAEPFDAKETRVLLAEIEEVTGGCILGAWRIKPGHINHFLTCRRAKDFREKKD
jgi:fructosamine-3-kinase